MSVADPCPRPFKGVNICATGITDKPTLFKQAMELGATCLSALTDRVTHLIAVDHGGGKYLCALERQIPILKPSWITENYQIWLKGDDVDFKESIELHRLPIFSGIALSLSGLTDVTQRMDITEQLVKHQGVYLENLERPVRITHILCSGDEVTEKVKYAKKFNQRGEANIRLVWEEWFWDSLEFGGRFNEAEYDIQLPRGPRRKVIFDAIAPPPAAIPKFTNQSPSQCNQPQPPTPAVDEDEEITCIAHRPAVTLQIWGGLLKKRGYEVAHGKIMKSPSKARVASPLQEILLADKNEPMDITSPKATSVISASRRANSFAPVDENDDRVSQRLRPFRRTTTVASISPEESQRLPAHISKPTEISNLGAVAATGGGEAGPSTFGPRGLFSGLKVCVLGEARSTSVRNAIEQAGGMWVSESEMDEDVDYIIVRLVSGSKIYREEPDEQQRRKYRTECWLERCLFEERICPYEDHITFVPLSIELPVTGSEHIVMSFSGLDQCEICWLTRLLRALGIRLASAFSQRSTHLLCPSGAGLKYEKAGEWGIPAVSREWLAAIATRGVIPPATEYVVKPGVVDPKSVAGESMHVDTKGKTRLIEGEETGKELAFPMAGGNAAVDVMMSDITNGQVDQSRPPPAKDSMASHVAMHPSKKPPERQISRPIQRSNLNSTDALSFGQPMGLLGDSPAGLERPVVSTAHPHGITHNNVTDTSIQRQESLILDKCGLRGDFNETVIIQDLDPDVTTQPPIPSSKTPSPIKIPRDGSLASMVSPIRIDQALQESIASLLGKRQGDDDATSGVRNGKRSRQHRRPMSKQSSTSSINFDMHLSSEPDPLYDKDPVKKLGPITTDDAHFDDEVMLMDETMAQERTTWVAYEDPAQLSERKRLLNLLKNPNPNPDVVADVDAEMVGQEKVQAHRTRVRPKRKARAAGGRSSSRRSTGPAVGL
ncbi:hypothetical protein AX17_005544 [Amanita inopinata Kibby_2008]|nr:hypothetical protein AX17_005544 [Amanita inopinata Kibby_2008]